MKSYIIKIYQNYQWGKKVIAEFFDDIAKTIDYRKFIIWINYNKWEIWYSLQCDDDVYPAWESNFYSSFNNFQISKDDSDINSFDPNKTVVWELTLENDYFFPFKFHDNDDTDLVYNMFRSMENLDISNDKLAYYIVLEPVKTDWAGFLLKSKWNRFWFDLGLNLSFWKYLRSVKIQSWRKNKWRDYHNAKILKKLFKTKIYIVSQSSNAKLSEGKIKSIFNNFKVFSNYPLNKFNLDFDNSNKNIISLAVNDTLNLIWLGNKPKSQNISNIYNTNLDDAAYMSPEELSQIFQFPKNPQNETSLAKVTSKKLSLPVWVPTLAYEYNNKNEVIAKNIPSDINIIWISDYRSTSVPIGVYDEDRLRHIYVIGKTWVGKSKFMENLIINDIESWRWIALLDPHGDSFDLALSKIPEHRRDDVIIFDPADTEFPFCFNPLDVKETESKQVLAKWFIDIFRKFFGSNWNSMLEHVLRMIFLALLDKPWATLFDIIRALTDKDFRYDMIECINDDVVRNFWTNEFAWWSQQFNSNAIMPILNKVGQLLSIDMLKNIFASKENKLDFREAMDSGKIILVKLSKGKLQEEIMWFLGAMFVTKIYQAAMSRAGTEKKDRKNFYLYVDEFQNFATDTFNEILSEARKYWLGMCIAHQFIKQIPNNISDALFGNVGTIVSFRVSSEDGAYMAKHFDPFLTGYDLANLSMRECYVKLQVKWIVKDPFSVRTAYIPETIIDKNYISDMYNLSRSRYNRTLVEAKKVVEEDQKDVLQTIDDFAEPLI